MGSAVKACLLLVFAALAAPLQATGPDSGQSQAVRSSKSVYIVRHFQKGEGADPSLTVEGAANAQRLAAALKDKGVRAIFATATKRAMESATPLAKQLGLKVTPYDPADPAGLAAEVTAAGGAVLIVGHSNTVPALVELFGGARPAPIADTEYGTLYEVEPDGRVIMAPVR
jgi:broad specificity phosphatase PhoE